MSIGQKIDMLCDKLDIKKQDFAERLGITPQYLSRVINGKQVPSETLLGKMCELANVKREFFDDDAEAVDIRETPIMEHLPEDLRDWVLNEKSRPYIVLAKMISDRRINDDELTSIVKAIQSDKDNTDRK